MSITRKAHSTCCNPSNNPPGCITPASGCPGATRPTNSEFVGLVAPGQPDAGVMHPGGLFEGLQQVECAFRVIDIQHDKPLLASLHLRMDPDLDAFLVGLHVLGRL